MDHKLKADWIAALRSGDYEQTDGLLRRSIAHPAFCCLGVLCDVMGAGWDTGSPKLDGYDLQHEDEELLSERTLDLVGLDEQTQTALAGMNDDGSTFPEIADYIEREIP